MNGRIYDPTLGRFLQADPHIQAPMNSQNYNRYSYVLNNPMSMTDPSGYFFKWAAKKLLGKAGAQIAGFGIGGLAGAAFGAWSYERTMNSQGLQTIASVALNFIPGCQVWCSALFSAQVNYYHTGSLSAAFYAGGRTAATAGVFHAIGSAFNETSGFWEVNSIQHVAAHAIAGGIISDVQGGNFGHGFFAAGVTKGFHASDKVSDNLVVGTVQSAVVGGTASVISGGKFANGARTAAFQYLYNQARISYRKIWKDIKRTWSDYWDNANSELSGVYAVGFESTGVRGNLAVKGGYGVFWDTKEGVIDFYQKVGYNLNPLDFSEAYGYESSAGFSFDYSRNASDFFGQSAEYSISVPFSPLGLDAATTYGPGVVSNTSFGFDIGWEAELVWYI